MTEGLLTPGIGDSVVVWGVSYPQGSLKARLCVAGRKQHYGYCASRNVPARAIGKLIVATTAAPRRPTRRCSRNCPTYILPTLNKSRWSKTI